MPGRMEDVLDTTRRNITRWAITTSPLIVDAVSGSTTVKVKTTRRFSPGDEFLIKATNDSGEEVVENRIIVADVPDKNTITTSDPLQFTWLVSQDAAIVKTIKDNFIRSIHIGEPTVIRLDELPSITVNGVSKSSEWYTIRATKERYSIEIGIYVVDGDHEDSYRFLLNVVEAIETGLKKNIYPMVNSYDETDLIASVQIGDKVVKVADSSIFQVGGMVYFENSYDCQENTVSQIIDSQTVLMMMPMYYDFPLDDAKVIRPHRFIYNSWPADIQFGKIHKGTLLKAAVINYFVEETEIQGNGGFLSTQLK